MAGKVYFAFREQLHQCAPGFPLAPGQEEMKPLERLSSEEEAEMLLQLSPARTSS